MIKKILFIIAVLLLSSCDYTMKKCTYEVYQHGQKLPEPFVEHVSLSSWCIDFSKNGVVYKLKNIEAVKAEKIKH